METASGKLFQQYIVDAYVRTEAAQFDFIRRNQSNLWVDICQGLVDHIQSQAEDQLQPGKVVILPSSFQGSPRAMQQISKTPCPSLHNMESVTCS